MQELFAQFYNSKIFLLNLALHFPFKFSIHFCVNIS